jgi:hypothetical protein
VPSQILGSICRHIVLCLDLAARLSIAGELDRYISRNVIRIAATICVLALAKLFYDTFVVQ